MKGGDKMVNKNGVSILTVIVISIIVALVVSVATVSLTGNVVKVASVTTGTDVYTKTEIDSAFVRTSEGIRFDRPIFLMDTVGSGRIPLCFDKATNKVTMCGGSSLSNLHATKAGYACINNQGEIFRSLDPCDKASTCTPATCTSLGKTCGTWSNGCGATLNCGVCPTTTTTTNTSMGRIISFEAESGSQTSIVRGAHNWTLISSVSAVAYSGRSAMQNLPNNGTNVGSKQNGVLIAYPVNFQETGIYYVWIRGLGPSAADDSINVGLNGATSGPGWSGEHITGFSSSYPNWARYRSGGSRATINVTSIGTLANIFSIGMREDGVIVDKIVLTKNSTYVPTDFGPAVTQ